MELFRSQTCEREQENNFRFDNVQLKKLNEVKLKTLLKVQVFEAFKMKPIGDLNGKGTKRTGASLFCGSEELNLTKLSIMSR